MNIVTVIELISLRHASDARSQSRHDKVYSDPDCGPFRKFSEDFTAGSLPLPLC